MTRKKLICFSDYWLNRNYLEIDGISKTPLKKIDKRTYRRLHVSIDGVEFFYIQREIIEFNQFCLLLSLNPALRDAELLWFQIVPPAKNVIDYKFNYMVTRTLWEKIEVDYMMSWLSTLGGGFSALGEQFSKCAETAGKISLRQLSIGLRLGDPFLQARCKLYYSISLIQTGRLNPAKRIVRQQYKFAIAQKALDERLVKMCQGIWLRIQYEYSIRAKEKKRQKPLSADKMSY